MVAQSALAVIFGVAALLLMMETPAMKSDVGRLLVLLVLSASIASYPAYSMLYLIDKAIVLAIAVPVMLYCINKAVAPTHTVISLQPLLIELKQGAYNLSCSVKRAEAYGVRI